MQSLSFFYSHTNIKLIRNTNTNIHFAKIPKQMFSKNTYGNAVDHRELFMNENVQHMRISEHAYV